MSEFITHVPEPPQPPQGKTDYVAFAMLANVCMTLVLMGGVYHDNGSATVAVISGAVFFLFFGIFVVGARSGLFASVAMNGQNNKTVRHQAQLQYWAQVQPVASWQIEHSQPAQPLLGEGRFVPAVEDATRQVRLAAAGWAQQLFDDDGERNRLITPKKYQIQVSEPAPEVVAYLESLDMVRREGTNLHWQVDNYPTAANVVPSIMKGVRLPPQSGGIGGRVRGVNAPSYTSGGAA